MPANTTPAVEYFCLIKDKEKRYAHMDDVSHETLDEAVREAVILRRKCKRDWSVLGVYSIDMKTGAVVHLLTGDQITDIADRVKDSDWDYFANSLGDIPLPIYHTMKPVAA